MRFSNLIEILRNKDQKRHYIIISAIILIIALFVLSIVFVLIYSNSEKIEYFDYTETSDVDYKVYLKENVFFENQYSSTNQKYIASLISNIEVDFDYKLTHLENVKDYVYLYNIEAVINVQDKYDYKSIYTKTTNLMEGQVLSANKEKNIDISENLQINYEEYNNLISDFIDVYDLNNLNSTLTINMWIKLAENEDKLINANKKIVNSLEIPLTTQTVAIEMSSSEISTNGNDSIFIKNNNASLSLVKFAILFFIIGIIGIVLLVKYYQDTKTDENVFSDKLRSILHGYKGYIQKIESTEFDFNEYQSIYLDSFNDLIEIRDTLQEPILMLENKNSSEVHFFILSQTKVVYIFWLGTDKVRKRLGVGKHNEEYIES